MFVDTKLISYNEIWRGENDITPSPKTCLYLETTVGHTHINSDQEKVKFTGIVVSPRYKEAMKPQA